MNDTDEVSTRKTAALNRPAKQSQHISREKREQVVTMCRLH